MGIDMNNDMDNDMDMDKGVNIDIDIDLDMDMDMNADIGRIRLILYANFLTNSKLQSIGRPVASFFEADMPMFCPSTCVHCPCPCLYPCPCP
jgi:hypothetical protein